MSEAAAMASTRTALAWRWRSSLTRWQCAPRQPPWAPLIFVKKNLFFFFLNFIFLFLVEKNSTGWEMSHYIKAPIYNNNELVYFGATIMWYVLDFNFIFFFKKKLILISIFFLKQSDHDHVFVQSARWGGCSLSNIEDFHNDAPFSQCEFSGAVFYYRRNAAATNGKFEFKQYLKAALPQRADLFGSFIDFHGNHLVIGVENDQANVIGATSKKK